MTNDKKEKEVDYGPTENGSSREIWKRGLFTLLLMIAFEISQTLLYLLAVVQFLWLLFAKEPNQVLRRFGRSLSVWMAETARFFCCDTEQKPFPWTDWPNED